MKIRFEKKFKRQVIRQEFTNAIMFKKQSQKPSDIPNLIALNFRFVYILLFILY